MGGVVGGVVVGDILFEVPLQLASESMTTIKAEIPHTVRTFGKTRAWPIGKIARIQQPPKK